jgi:hypothetical protein
MMGDDCVTICKNTAAGQTVEQYYNLVHARPILLLVGNPTVGIEKANIDIEDGFLTCSFKRQKQNNQTKNYCDLNDPFFILAAYGPMLTGFRKMQKIILFLILNVIILLKRRNSTTFI